MIYTICGTPIATGFVRIEHGGRGDYMEFSPDQIIWSNLFIPDDAIKRIGTSYHYYLEYRTKDKCNVKVYHQKKVVDYANYIVGMLYIAPRYLTNKISNLTAFMGVN